MDRFLKASLAVSVLLMAVSVAYYCFYYKPATKRVFEIKLEGCFAKADEEFYASWESICREEGEEGQCSDIRGYPVYFKIEGVKDDAKKRCVQLYNISN